MQYKPRAIVWEITMGCNMRCKHCGSSCEDALSGELSTEEALKLCDDLADLGVERVTLSGGEPTTRKDWHLIAERLNKNGVRPSLITNGWLTNEDIVDKAIQAGIRSFGISIDGLEATHDFMRREGAFQRAMNALDLIHKKGKKFAAVITTINQKNMGELNALKDILIEKNVNIWQLQCGLPMGNMHHHRDMTVEPHHLNNIVDFALEASNQDQLEIALADCIGYYDLREVTVRNKNPKRKQNVWKGCTAGKFTFGILHNGDVLGCTSIRDRSFIEGNIRNQSLREIWESDKNFLWNREMKKEKLEGLCGQCQFGNYCHGGCSNTKLVLGGSVYSENKYCLFNVAVQEAVIAFEQIEDFEELKAKGRNFAEQGNYQLAEMLLSKALQKDSNHIEVLSMYGFAAYMLENYEAARSTNEKLIALAPQSAYANKGMGLTLYKLGQIEEGLDYLKKAVALSDDTFTEPYYDMAVVLAELGKVDEACAVLEEGRTKSEAFVERSRQLYEHLKNCR